MTDERERIRRKQHAARLRQAERVRQAETEKRQAALNLPPPGPERLAELERRHVQARDREPQEDTQLAQALRTARRQEQLRLARQAELDEQFPPRYCHFCHQPGAAFGFAPPGWTTRFWACFTHHPPHIVQRKQPGEKTGAQLMAELLARST